jgi:hypothetical protein
MISLDLGSAPAMHPPVAFEPVADGTLNGSN